MFNEVTLIGNLGQDPDVRRTQAGDKVANISVATTERWTTKEGEKKEVTQWHRCVIWGKLADVVEKYLHKGSKVFIVGQMTYGTWTDKNGIEQKKAEVVLRGFGGKLVMLDAKGDRPEKSQVEAAPAEIYPDDDIPF